METGINRKPTAGVIADALIVPGFEGQEPKVSASVDELIAELYSSGEFTGEKSATALLRRPEGMKAARIALAGCGKPADFTPAVLRNMVGEAIRKHRSKAVRRFALLLDGPLATGENVTAAVEGALIGAYDPDRYKTDEKKADKVVESFSVNLPDAGAGLAAAFERGRIIGESQNFARDLAYEPGNVLTPLELAARARSMAADVGLECDVLDRDRMKQLGMGALLGVAQGSAEPPALIVLRYQPETEAGGEVHLGLVGKGVTFDTGGISIKPSEKMDEMKFDMCGAAAMLGAMRAIARIKPAIRITALVPTVENMPGSRAQRPGDIVKTMAGKTVEVLNTDAEGRLILIDALTYAQRLGCTHLVDAATLTGSVVVALGNVNTGVFSNDDQLAGRLLVAAKSVGEKMWRLPLDDEYKELLKSPYADLPNIGTRAGGSITAALFLREFADPKPWVHLDIAGTAWITAGKPFMAKGPTGVAVRTMVELATSWPAG